LGHKKRTKTRLYFSAMFSRQLFDRALKSPAALLLTVILGFVGGILIIIEARLVSQTINQVFLEGAGRSEVQMLLVWLFGIILLRGVVAWSAELAANRTAVQVKNGLREQLFRHIQALGPAYVRGERAGEITSTATEGIEALDAYFREYLPQLALAAILPVTFLVFIVPLDWVSGLILLLTAPLIPVFMLLIGSLAEALTRRQWKTLSRMSAYFLDVLQGLTTLKILGRSRAQIQVIQLISDQFRERTMDVLRVAFLSALVLELLSTLSTALIAVGIGLRLLYGQLAFVDAFFILLLAPEFYLPLRLLGTRFHAGMAGISAAERISQILAQDHPYTPAEFIAGLGSPPEISLDGIVYTYPGESSPALAGISLSIPAGKRVAVVGPSGAGKSTLAAVLLGMVQPQAGQIRINGQPAGGLSNPHWLDQVAWVPQNPFLFQASVADNIRLSEPAAPDEAVIHAAKLAQAHEFITELPQGYATLIGERGARLSGGQAQRIALARAFLKHAQFLVMDEATANLDPELEARLQTEIEKLVAGRTVFLIAHRLATVRSADLVIVMDTGKIVQTGTHHNLLQQPGLYRSLVAGDQENLDTDADQPVINSFEASRISSGSALKYQPLQLENGKPGPFVSPRSRLQLLGLLAGFLKPFLGWVTASVLLGFATIASGIGLMTTSAYLIASAALQPSIAALQVPIVGVRFFGISRGIFRYLERLASHQATFRVLAGLRVWFYRALEPLAPARLLQYQGGDLLSRITADINQLENFYVRGVAPPLVAVIVGVVMFIFMASFAPLLGWLLVLFFVAAGIGLPWLGHMLAKSPGQALAGQRAALFTTLVEGIQGLPDQQVYQQTAAQAARLVQQGQAYSTSQSAVARGLAFQNSGLLVLNHLCMWVVLLAGIPLVEAGRFDGVALAVLVLAALSSFEAVQPVGQAASTLESSLQSASRLDEIVSAVPAVLDPPRPAPPPGNSGLSVRGLTFIYPGTARPALLDFSMDLPVNGRVALVGPSGAGKSTLVSLLLRLWETSPGSITLGGLPLEAYRQEDVRRRIAVVSQRTDIFHATVRDNLLIARPDASQEQIEAACREARIHDRFASLPEGYGTYLGEQGSRLSAGERQRLSLARALLREAPLLILDEATANLDTLTEVEIWESIQMAAQGRSVLVISHRLAGLESMDQIYVLRAGKLVEKGTHPALLKAGGFYAHMLRLQNQVFDVSMSPDL
jgi:ATP-binding cassette, subfamily C, bacterial CydCD